jgi:hypothetical protein
MPIYRKVFDPLIGSSANSDAASLPWQIYHLVSHLSNTCMQIDQTHHYIEIMQYNHSICFQGLITHMLSLFTCYCCFCCCCNYCSILTLITTILIQIGNTWVNILLTSETLIVEGKYVYYCFCCFICLYIYIYVCMYMYVCI